MPRVKLFDEKEVLNKAVNLFWKQGYSATSVQELVCHCGINRASLYDTFGDKEQLFNKALEHYRKGKVAELIQFFQSHKDVKKGLSQLFEIAIDECVNDQDKKGCFVVNTTTELIPGHDNILQLLEENKIQLETLFYEYLKAGKDSGQFTCKQDLKSMASLLYILFSGIRVVAKVKPDKTELTNSLHVVLSLLV